MNPSRWWWLPYLVSINLLHNQSFYDIYILFLIPYWERLDHRYFLLIPQLQLMTSIFVLRLYTRFHFGDQDPFSTNNLLQFPIFYGYCRLSSQYCNGIAVSYKSRIWLIIWPFIDNEHCDYLWTAYDVYAYDDPCNL